MDSQDIPVSLSCGKCGSNNLGIPDNPGESFVVKCQSCGTVIGTWGEIKSAATKQAAEMVNKKLKDALRKSFKDDPNFTVE